MAVIGGGIIGLTTALALAEAGFEVHVFDRDRAGRAASWAGGGILSALPPNRIPVGLETLLEQSLALYPQFCQQLHDSTGIDPEYWVCGAEFHQADGQVTRFPQMAQVRNPRLLRALLAQVPKSGIQLHEQTPVVGIESVEGRVCAIRTDVGLFHCEVAVVCAGAWSSALGATGIEPVKGQMLLLRGEPDRLTRILMNESAYLIPRHDGRILVGSTLEPVGYDLQPTPQARDWLLGQAGQLLSGLERLVVEHHWAGLRPRPADGLPLIGRDPLKQGLYYNTGHYRLGITLAPASACRLLQVVKAGG